MPFAFTVGGGKELLPSRWLHVRESLAITSGNCRAGVWAGRWESHGKALERPKLTSQYSHWKIILETGSVVCDQLDLWEGAALLSVVVAYLCNGGLSVSVLYADTARVGAVAGHWGQAGNSHSAHSFRLRQVSKSCPDICPPLQGHLSNPHCAGYWTSTNISSLTQEPAAQSQISTDYPIPVIMIATYIYLFPLKYRSLPS